MRVRWRNNSISQRLILLVIIASLVPAALLIGGSWYFHEAVRQQTERNADDTLNLAINLQQTLIDGRLTRMQERAVALAGNPTLAAALGSPGDLQGVLEGFRRSLPGADLITVVDQHSVVRGRAGSAVTGETVRYGGLVQHVLAARVSSSSAVVIPKQELNGESAHVLSAVRMPIVATDGAADPRAGEMLEDALALVGAAPILDPDGSVVGVVLVGDILNNDHSIVNEVTNRSPPALPIHATIALDGIRVTTTVPAIGGGKRAVGTLYSDQVMEKLRAGQEYRGRAKVGGWLWERTIYLPLADPSGQVVAGSFVGIPESNFAEINEATARSAQAGTAIALLSLLAAAILAYRLAVTSINRPLQRFITVLTGGNLHVRVGEDETEEMAKLAGALNGMIERTRQTVTEMARVSRGVQAASDDLADRARQTAENAEGALQVVAHAMEAAEKAVSSAQQATGRMRDLEVALARIDAGSEEQARALNHASTIISLVATSVQEAREGLQAVIESTREAVGATQQARHYTLRSFSALNLVRAGTQSITEGVTPAAAAGPDWTLRADRLIADLEDGQKAADQCDNALRQIARSTEETSAQLWSLAAVQNENSARAGAVSQQMSDLARGTDETTIQIRSMSAASRQVMGEVEAMALGIESVVGLVRRAETHVTTIAEANRRLHTLSERIRALAAELDQATGRFPGADSAVDPE